ncbi:hypothetical protein YYE_04992, partial [Plasmodium vinckei vinckei]
CKLLLDGDSYFNGKDVNTQKINNELTIKGFCNNGVCKTNEAGINALAVYIHNKFKNLIKRQSQYNHYDEYLLMWISDKLFKIHIESIGKKNEKGYIDAFTLNKAYNTYLKKHKAKLDYWVLFDNIKGLKDANLKYMSEYYKLLNKICKIITDYNNSAKSKKVLKYSSDCSFQYKTLYKNIFECQSYLDLLNKLKGTYDDFISYATMRNRSNNNLATKLKKLKPEDGEEMDAVRGFKTYDFSNEECKLPKKKKKIVSSKKAESPAADSPPPQSGQDGGSSKTGGSNGQDPSKDSENSKENKGDASGNKGSQSGGNGNSDDGSSGPTSSTSGGSFGWRLSIFELILEGNEYYNKASDFINQNQQKFKDAGKKISGAYNSAVDILKSAYNASSIYFNGMINSITNQINQYDTPKSRKSGDKFPQSNDQSQKSGDLPQTPPKEQTQITSPDPSQPNQLPPQTQDGQSKDNHLQESPPTQNIDSPNSKQVNPSDSGDNQSESGGTGDNSPTPNGPSPLQKYSNQQNIPQQISPQSSSETSPKSKEQTQEQRPSQGTSGNQNSDRTNQEGPKKPVTSPVVKKENIGTESKGNVITEIGGEYVLKKYKKIVFSIIVILIPITLTILYKYLSSGWRKELKKKTNMKKVINSIGGKKQIQIIIKSSNQKKNTKKSINSVYGEKSPSLNIYKIMQADPKARFHRIINLIKLYLKSN